MDLRILTDMVSLQQGRLPAVLDRGISALLWERAYIDVAT